jgi:hypothetical protein
VVFLCSVRRLLVKARVVPSSPILVTLMKEALCSSETTVLTRAIRHNIPEDTIFFYRMSFVRIDVWGKRIASIISVEGISELGTTLAATCNSHNICLHQYAYKQIKIPWLLVRKRTMPIDRPSLVGEVIANFAGRGLFRCKRNRTRRPLMSVF